MQHRAATTIDRVLLDPLLHDRRAQQRASQALRCLPFRLAFYRTVSEQALSSNELCRRNDSRSLCRGTLTADRIEAQWMWLIQLGVLRREVVGQGLTERVRLTPMGRTLLDQWSEEIPAATLLDRLQHVLRRRRPRL
jgi:hypothetical protein